MNSTMGSKDPKFSQRKSLPEIIKFSNLSKSQKELWNLLWVHGPMTALELDHEMKMSNSRARLSEMRQRDLVADSERRICQVSGKPSKTWTVTGKTPGQTQQYRERTLSSTPSPHDIKTFVKEFRVIMAIAHGNGSRISPSMRRVLHWLDTNAQQEVSKRKKRSVNVTNANIQRRNG